MNRRRFARTLTGGATTAALVRAARSELKVPPNIVLILADDLGFGDLGCYGSRIRTPNLDRMAARGALFRQFCSASSVCSPSRAALLTGRYGARVGVPCVLGPRDPGGLNLSETTLPQSLKASGYRSMCVGKWHLGASGRYLPTARGFDDYFGIPYSSDQWPSVLMRGTAIVESPVDLCTITRRYTQQAIQFIRESANSPFFLFLSHAAPHVPLEASPEFRFKSPLGVYGDVVEELDWSVGQVLSELSTLGLAENTLVIFTSDNGAWYQGSRGRLRGRKGETFEGGMRVPMLASWPGHIPEANVVESFASSLDLLPTIASLAGAPLPENPLDGVNIWPVLSGEAVSVPRPVFLYIDGYDVQCARMDKWKLHLARNNGPAFAPRPEGGRINLPLCTPELYDMDVDSDESCTVARENLGVVAEIRGRVEAMLPSFPLQVQSAWRETLGRATAPMNAGEWPSLQSG